MFKLPGWWSRATASSVRTGADSLDAFGSERSEGSYAPRAFSEARNWVEGRAGLLAPLAIAVLIAVGAAGGYFINWRPFQVEAASASLMIESEPAGAEVVADGVRQGTTPLALSVTPGAHAFEIVSGTRRKSLQTVARAGAAVVHHVQFDAPSPAATRAALKVVTEPARLRVLLDGKSMGMSPLMARDLAPGAHTVQVIGNGRKLERKVDLYAGETASVIISAAVTPTAGPAVGWLTVLSPVSLQILQGPDLIGTSEAAKIMIPAGSHALQLTNDALGLSERRVVQVTAGATAIVRVELPKAPLSINALPWAEVWIDGTRAGETPIANYQVPVGTHEVVFRHPELGERRQTVTISLKSPSRVSVDMRKPQ
jgi:PEGA domain